MSWDENKVQTLRDLWGKGKTSKEIAEIIGGISRNAVIGKAHRLNLSAKIKARSSSKNHKLQKLNSEEHGIRKHGRRSLFKSLIIEKGFPPENPKQLEELENHCRWPIGHPDQPNFYFCGRQPLKDFSYCKLHILFAFQQKSDKKEVSINKEDDVPQFIEKKIKSA